MFSLNVPLPGRLRAQVEGLRPDLADFETVRREPTLVAKRFGRRSAEEAAHIEAEVRTALAGAPTFEARLDGLDTFESPPTGPAPVVYLAVESPGLEQLHERLVGVFGAVEGLEGDDYVPHVTVARGLADVTGGPSAASGPDPLDRLADVEVEPVSWTVTELWFWDARHGERVGRVSLPG